MILSSTSNLNPLRVFHLIIILGESAIRHPRDGFVDDPSFLIDQTDQLGFLKDDRITVLVLSVGQLCRYQSCEYSGDYIQLGVICIGISRRRSLNEISMQIDRTKWNKICIFHGHYTTYGVGPHPPPLEYTTFIPHP